MRFALTDKPLSAMNTKEKKLVAQSIREHICKLEAQTKGSTSIREQLSDQLQDDDARLETIANAAVDETTQLQMKRELEQLHSNLEWLSGEHGGKCEECHSDIPVGRLIIVPTTRLCVNCSSLHEHN